MIALTGARSWTMDMEACTARGIVVRHTAGQQSTPATAELTLGLLLAAARLIPTADASIRAGGFQNGVPAGTVLEGRTLGVIGLGLAAAVAAHGPRPRDASAGMEPELDRGSPPATAMSASPPRAAGAMSSRPITCRRCWSAAAPAPTLTG